MAPKRWRSLLSQPKNCYQATDKATRSQGAIWRTVGSLSLLASLQRIHEGLACGSLTRRLHALGQLVLLKLTHWLAACCRCRSTLMTMNHLSLTRAHDSIHRTIGHSHSGACRHAGHHGTHQPRHHATTRRSKPPEVLQLVQQPVEVPAWLQQELALVLPCHRKALGAARWGALAELRLLWRGIAASQKTNERNTSIEFEPTITSGASELGSAVAQACAALNTNLRNLSF